jgi:hypothetical protein
MRVSKIKSLLEVVTNVAVLLAAVGVLSALSWGYFAQRSAPPVQNGFQRGQPVAKLPKVDYSGAPKTLLIAMNTGCHFCTESIPFYNGLVSSNPGTDKTTRVVAVFPNKEDEVRQYVRQHQLNLEAVAGVDFRALNVSATPTMILVDSNGKVLDFWVGKQSEDGERLIVKTINAS